MRLLACLILLPWPPHPAQAAGLGELSSMRQRQMQQIERQTLDYSCGAAALAILLRLYFGQEIEEQDVLADIITRLPKDELADRIKEGFSMLDLKHSVQRLGYAAEGAMLTPEQATLLQGPVIILLHRDGLKHFVVLKGVREGRALLADSVRGHVRLPWHALLQEWHGETLIVGRPRFGLPIDHPLRLPSSAGLAPERETMRALRHLPLN